MRIAIVGSGAVGGYFGGRLAEAGADVTFLARGAHLEAMRARGLRITSPKGDVHLPHVQTAGDTRDVGPVDVVLFAVKLYDMLKDAVREAQAVARAKGIAVPSTTIEDVARAYAALPRHTKSSMLEDLERGRRLELPWLSGAVVRIGEEVGVPTPIHRFIATVVKPFVNGSLG
jgi:ketopantoate reductase